MSDFTYWRRTTVIAGATCILVFFAILFGTRAILDATINEALSAEAGRHAGHLEEQIVQDFPWLAEVVTSGRVDAQHRAHLEMALNHTDGLVQIKLFNVRGRLRFVLDEARWFTQGGDIQSDAALRSVEGRQRVLEILRPGDGHVGDGFLSRATLPLYDSEGGLVGAYEITQDQTEIAELFLDKFTWLTVALPVFSAILFLVPAIGWLLLRGRNGRNEVLVHDLARMDRLTGLMNRSTFTQEAATIIEDAARDGLNFGLLILDIDHFRLINDSHGHKIADAFLRHVAGAISETVRSDDLVARFGGDEFVALLPDVAMSELQSIANRIVLHLGTPFLHFGSEVSANASVGIYISERGDDLDSAMQAAELAQAYAKECGRDKVVAYSENLDQMRVRRHMIEASLRDAWESGRAFLEFQPVIATEDTRIRGFEALMRLTTEDGEAISPEEFIPIAERTGQIRDLGLSALRRAMETALTWPFDIFVAVNMSPAQFSHGDLVEQVSWLLDDLRFPVERLEIEITESLPLSEDQQVKQQFNGLKDIGVSIAMDDFGTGFSSLSYLLAHNFDKLKIDRMFLNEFHGDPERHRNILRSIITLGRQIGMTVTVEGVEFPEQEEMLASMGCDLLQGFLYSRPLRSEAIAPLLARHNPEVSDPEEALQQGPVRDAG